MNTNFRFMFLVFVIFGASIICGTTHARKLSAGFNIPTLGTGSTGTGTDPHGNVDQTLLGNPDQTLGTGLDSTDTLLDILDPVTAAVLGILHQDTGALGNTNLVTDHAFGNTDPVTDHAFGNTDPVTDHALGNTGIPSDMPAGYDNVNVYQVGSSP